MSMTFRGEVATDDWAFGRGKQSYLSENYAIIKEVETKLRMFYSECFFDPEAGVDWFNLLGQKNQDIVVLAIKREINSCYGVTAVTDVRYSLDTSRNMTIRYWINTIYSVGASGVVKL